MIIPMAKVKSKKQKKEPIGKVLNPRQEKFCRNYTQNDSMFGNATLSYADAYGYDLDSLNSDPVYDEVWDETTGKAVKQILQKSEYQKAYDICSKDGNRLLRNAKINDRIVKLLNEMMTEEQADSELMKTMKQTEDYGAKLAAIREYNKLKQRISNKLDLTSKGEKIQPIVNIIKYGETEKMD